MDSKGLISPEEWREFCNDVVPLFVTGKFCWTNRETLTGQLKIADYSNRDLNGKRLRWTLKDNTGTPIDQGTLKIKTTGKGLSQIGTIAPQIASITRAQKVNLELLIEGTEYKNHYALWVYPDEEIQAPDEEIYISKQLDERMINELQKGNRVLWFPDSATYAFASAEQSEEIEALAQECADTLNGWATAEQGRSERYTSMYEAAGEYAPRAYEVLGATMESAQAVNYMGSQLLTPADIENYGSTLTEAIEQAGYGTWFVYNMGTSYAAMCAVDPLDAASLSVYKSSADLLSAMKGEEVQQMLYDTGATLEQALDQSAMNVYKPANIKRSA